MVSDKEKFWGSLFLNFIALAGAVSFWVWQHSIWAGLFAGALLYLVARVGECLINAADHVPFVALLLAKEFGKEDGYYKDLEKAHLKFAEEMREEEEKVRKDPDRVRLPFCDINLRPVLRAPRPPTTLAIAQQLVRISSYLGVGPDWQPGGMDIAQQLVRINSHLERLTKAAEHTSSVNGKTPPSV
ncbi:MAG: hypothetical protein ABSB82_01115 [Terriglobia bacterium]|jgi:hypothetical protein